MNIMRVIVGGTAQMTDKLRNNPPLPIPFRISPLQYSKVMPPLHVHACGHAHACFVYIRSIYINALISHNNCFCLLHSVPLFLSLTLMIEVS